MMRNDEALKYMEQKIMKEYGSGVLKIASEMDVPTEDVISTGINVLDEALGSGGIPVGKVIEIYGDAGSGKTTLALSIAKQAQKRGAVLYIDADHGLSPYMLNNMGINIDRFYTANVLTMEDALEICTIAVKGFSLIIIDSIAALCPAGESKMGDYYTRRPQAVLMNQFLGVITKLLSKSECSVILVNQLRTNPQIMFGNPEKTPCGKALKYYASVRMDTRLREAKKGKATFAVVVAKNKYYTPFKRVEFSFAYSG